VWSSSSYSGTIPECSGVVAFGETLSQCRKELRPSLEGWLIVKIRHGDSLPVLDRLDLNKRMPPAQAIDPAGVYAVSGVATEPETPACP